MYRIVEMDASSPKDKSHSMSWTAAATPRDLTGDRLRRWKFIRMVNRLWQIWTKLNHWRRYQVELLIENVNGQYILTVL